MEVKEILKALNLPEEIDTIEKVVEKHNSQFISLSDAHTDDRVVEKITGKIFGSLDTEAKKLFGLKNEDIKDKKFVDVLKLGVDKLNTQITELKSSGAEERFTKLTGEMNALKIQSDQYASDLEKVKGEKEQLQQGFDGKLKEFQIESIVTTAKSKLAFADAIPDVSKLGFDALIASKYKFDIDDKGNAMVLTKEGKKVANPTKTGTYLSIDEVLDSELDAAGLKKKNNLQGGQKFGQFKPNPNLNPDTNVRQVNPRAAAHAERLAASK